MTQEDLMYKIAERAKVLADYPLSVLRRSCAEHATSNFGAKVETFKMTRGDMIEKVLIDEFENRVTKED